jgi:hypothetical protein
MSDSSLENLAVTYAGISCSRRAPPPLQEPFGPLMPAQALLLLFGESLERGVVGAGTRSSEAFIPDR